MASVAEEMAKHRAAGRFKKGAGSLRSTRAKAKIRKTLHEFKLGTLHSGSKTGKKVTDHKQAVAIALSQARRKA